jgi:hypothetical protein
MYPYAPEYLVIRYTFRYYFLYYAQLTNGKNIYIKKRFIFFWGQKSILSTDYNKSSKASSGKKKIEWYANYYIPAPQILGQKNARIQHISVCVLWWKRIVVSAVAAGSSRRHKLVCHDNIDRARFCPVETSFTAALNFVD